MKEDNLERIVTPLLKWYEEKGRILPWREGRNPYKIWISEIMLQQTKIEAVKKYYERFMNRLPAIHDLAEIEETELLKLWEGLGYYNRARNLKKAAILIEKEYVGEMPKTAEELKKLPGIGEYTAGAIASIAFDERVTAVDGNVLRVASRILGSKEDVLLPDTKKKMTKKIQKIMPEEAGKFNEAIMELGETVCIPNGIPFCEVCPLKEMCVAKEKDLVLEIPVRQKKGERKKEQITVFILLCDGKIAIRRREGKGLLAGMYEFPNEREKMTVKQIEARVEEWNMVAGKVQKKAIHKHIFTHIEWDMIAYEIEVKEENKEFIWVEPKELEETYALPTAFAVFK